MNRQQNLKRKLGNLVIAVGVSLFLSLPIPAPAASQRGGRAPDANGAKSGSTIQKQKTTVIGSLTMVYCSGYSSQSCQQYQIQALTYRWRKVDPEELKITDLEQHKVILVDRNVGSFVYMFPLGFNSVSRSAGLLATVWVTPDGHSLVKVYLLHGEQAKIVLFNSSRFSPQFIEESELTPNPVILLDRSNETGAVARPTKTEIWEWNPKKEKFLLRTTAPAAQRFAILGKTLGERLKLLLPPAVVARIGVGKGPSALAVDPVTNRVFVANGYGKKLTVIDGTTEKVVATIPVGSSPGYLAVDPATNRVYVTTGERTLTVVDGSTNTVIARVTLADSPGSVAVNPKTNRVYVGSEEGDTVTVIDGSTNKITATVAAGPSSSTVAVNPATNRVYVGNGNMNLQPSTITVIDGATDKIIGKIHTPSPVGPMAVNPKTDRIYAVCTDSATGGDKIMVIDEATGSSKTLKVPSGNRVALVSGIAVNPVTNRIYAANYRSDDVIVIDGSTNSISKLDISRTPYDVVTDPATDRIFVANGGLDTVSVIDGSKVAAARKSPVK